MGTEPVLYAKSNFKRQPATFGTSQYPILTLDWWENELSSQQLFAFACPGAFRPPVMMEKFLAHRRP